ncbi:MAG: hypothetical protein A4E63_02721 [Syntrophorhabdus sp. PtaU1.Bin050]|nr:MAG: hypothetical protein A4E63_02721 [Syntrophorhabdus sp. PtaU1.Bin050]
MENKNSLISFDKKKSQGHKVKCGSFLGFSCYTVIKTTTNQNFLIKIWVEKWKMLEITKSLHKTLKGGSHYHER